MPLSPEDLKPVRQDAIDALIEKFDEELATSRISNKVTVSAKSDVRLNSREQDALARAYIKAGWADASIIRSRMHIGLVYFLELIPVET